MDIMPSAQEPVDLSARFPLDADQCNAVLTQLEDTNSAVFQAVDAMGSVAVFQNFLTSILSRNDTALPAEIDVMTVTQLKAVLKDRDVQSVLFKTDDERAGLAEFIKALDAHIQVIKAGEQADRVRVATAEETRGSVAVTLTA